MLCVSLKQLVARIIFNALTCIFPRCAGWQEGARRDLRQFCSLGLALVYTDQLRRPLALCSGEPRDAVALRSAEAGESWDPLAGRRRGAARSRYRRSVHLKIGIRQPRQIRFLIEGGKVIMPPGRSGQEERSPAGAAGSILPASPQWGRQDHAPGGLVTHVAWAHLDQIPAPCMKIFN